MWEDNSKNLQKSHSGGRKGQSLQKMRYGILRQAQRVDEGGGKKSSRVDIYWREVTILKGPQQRSARASRGW